MSVGTFIEKVKRSVNSWHRRSYSEPALLCWAQEENLVRFSRSRSLVYIGDLPNYEDMASLQVENLVNNGEIPKYNEVADSLASAQIWHQSKSKKEEWSVTTVQAAHCTKVGTIQDPNVPQVTWDKFKLSRARGLSCKEAILWQIVDTSGPFKVRTLILLDEIVFTKLRGTHVVKAPNLIHYIEGQPPGSGSKGELSSSQEEVFDNAQAEPETVQVPEESESPQAGKGTQKVTSPASVSVSILGRRGDVVTPKEREQRLKESLDHQYK